MAQRKELRAYLGDIHYHDGDGKDVTCRGAVWCASRDDFDTEVGKYLKDQGMNFLWSEEVHEALGWFRKFGNNGLMAGLAKKVDAKNSVALSDPKVSYDETADEDDSYLIIEETPGVKPLDMQMGVHPKLTVPAVLQDAMFGQPEPTEAEREQYGEDIPPMKTYAILDAAKMPYLLTGVLSQSGLEYQSLFQDEAQEELGEYAPYIVRLEDGNDFTRKLFTDLKPPLGLWAQELGIFVRSRASLGELRKHFRKFTKVQDENGKWYYFRFWEGRMLKHFLRATTYEKQTAFFAHPIQFFSRSHEEIWLKIYSNGPALSRQIGTLVLSNQDWRSFKTYRHTRYFSNLKKWLHASYDPPVNVDNVDEFIQEEAQLAIDHFKTYKGAIISHYVAASWLLGKRALDDNRLKTEHDQSAVENAKSLHHQAHAIRIKKSDTI